MEQYWIQDCNEHGNYSDSIGLQPGKFSREQALIRLAEWKAAFPERKSRLVLRRDEVIA